MRLWRNLFAGFGGTVWAAGISFAMVPVYLRYLGLEAYGLVGFFLAMQAVFQVVDLGLAPTMSREVARCEAVSTMASARNLMRTLSVFFWITGGVIAAVIYFAAPWIGTEWLSANKLSAEALVSAIALMGIVVGLRFPIGLYTGALQGAHRLAEASILNALLASFGAIGAVGILAFVSPTIQAFFAWQIVIALLQVIIVRWAAWRALGGAAEARLELASLRRVWRFSAGMGVVAVLGMVLTQLDKLVLSRAVTLDELGHYTLAGMAARVLTLFTGPVFAVVYPRLTALAATGSEAALLTTYRTGTRLLLAFLMPIAVFGAIFAVDLFTVWTGSAPIARSVETTVVLLMTGTALNAAMIFPYALQLAYGHSRTPATITAILIVGFVPLLLWLVPRWGFAGAAAAWAMLNIVYVPLGAAITHRTLLKGSGRAWLVMDVALPIVIAVLVVGGGGYLVRGFAWPPIARVGVGILLVPLAASIVIALSSSMRKQIFIFRSWFAPKTSLFRSLMAE